LRERYIAAAPDERTRASEMNDYAWLLAISGDDVKSARSMVSRSLEIIGANAPSGPENDSDPQTTHEWARLEANARDTFAYVLMLDGDMKAAHEELTLAITTARNAGIPIEQEWYYRDTVARCVLGEAPRQNDSDTASRYIAPAVKYVPTHERILLAGVLQSYPQCERLLEPQ
jgi:hypothetical protein